MGETEYVVTADAGNTGKSMGVCRLPAQLSDAHSNLGSVTDRIDTKTPGRNASRKKSRGKAKPARKFAGKVYPEELLGDACKDDESTSSYKSTQEHVDYEAISFVDCMKMSGTNVPNSKQQPECSSCGIYDIKRSHLLCDVCNCNGKNTQSATRVSNVQAVRLNSGAFVGNDAKKTRSHLHNMRKKDQSRFIWQRCQRDRTTQDESADLSLSDHVKIGPNTQASSFPIQQEPFAGDKHNIAACGTKTLDSEEELLCEQIYIGVRVDSSPDIAQQRVNSGFQPSISQGKPMGSTHSVDINNSDVNPSKHRRSRSNSWSTTRSQGSKFDRCQYRSVPSQTELLQVDLVACAALQRHFSCGPMFNLKNRGGFDVIQPCIWMKLPRVKPAEDNTAYRFLEGEWRDDSCLQPNIDIPCRIRRGQAVTQQPNSRKWIPVCKKKVKIPKSTVPLETCDNNNDNSTTGKNGFHSEGNLIPLCATDMSSGFGSTKLITTHNMTSLVEQAPEIKSINFEVKAQKVQLPKDYHQTFHVPEGFQHLYISAQMVEQAFIASYRLQVASESVQQATGYPIADFERLLCCATPFITSSHSCEKCDACSHNQLCNPTLCRDQIPNISLHAIWNWYEEPGNYGLKVNVDDTAPFRAHFVPLLSAVQLFGYQHLPSACGNSPDSSLDIHGNEANLQPSIGDPMITSSLKASHMGNTLVDMLNSRATNNSSDVFIPGQNEPIGVAREADLIFEFFESEQPQRRMPLHNKIMELASGGATSNQIYGDPSKLQCTNLDNLHPASWFSVAWYPIYRIPEGKFRAAFLTYHSLGYLVPRCMANNSLDKNTLGVGLPIIGLQSYNAQGELWFSPNTVAESSFRELTSLILRKRLGTLEENALLFARGMVSRDHVTVANRQPDYEFFMSRKH